MIHRSQAYVQAEMNRRFDAIQTERSVRGLSKKALVAKFGQDNATSDGGAVLRKACDEKLKLSTTLASCLLDDRQQSKGTHSLEELFHQRLFAIACGYAGGNDAAHDESRLFDLARCFELTVKGLGEEGH